MAVHELAQLARRQRKKNEGKARARAVCRLNPIDHEKYKEAERARKRAAVLATAWMTPVLWQPCEEDHSVPESPKRSSRVNEHVQVTPRGSREGGQGQGVGCQQQ